MNKTLELSGNWLKSYFEQLMLYNFPLEAFYKMPLALNILRQEENASVVIKYIEEHFNNNFYFNDGYNKNRKCDHYYDFWLLLNYIYISSECSTKVYNRILNSFNGESLSNSFNMNTNEFEVRATAFGGICAYFMNDNDVLNITANYLIKVFDFNNSNNKTNFHFIFDKNQNPLYSTNNIADRLYCYKPEQDSPLTYPFYLSCICLALAYMKSNDVVYLNYSEKYFNYLVLEDRIKFNSYSGKLGIASALLSNITKKQQYKKIANDIKKYFIYTQSDKGFWLISKSDMVTIKSIKENIINIDRTSEFSVSLYIIEYLLNNKLKHKG